jgi:hypothetical protein
MILGYFLEYLTSIDSISEYLIYIYCHIIIYILKHFINTYFSNILSVFIEWLTVSFFCTYNYNLYWISHFNLIAFLLFSVTYFFSMSLNPFFKLINIFLLSCRCFSNTLNCVTYSHNLEQVTKVFIIVWLIFHKRKWINN